MSTYSQLPQAVPLYVFQRAGFLERVTVAGAVMVALMLYLSMHGYIPILMTTDQTQAGVDGTVGQIVQAIFLLVLGLIALPSYKGVLKSTRYAGPLLATVAWALLSSLWSQDPNMTLRRSVMLAAPTLFALFLHARYSYRQQLDLMLFTGATAALLSVTLAVLLPKYGVDQTFHNGAWQGIFSQKNGCARACVFFMLPLATMLGRSANKTLLALMAFVIFGFLLVMTQSATGLVMAGIFVPSVIAFRVIPRLPRNEVAILALVLVAAAVGLGIAFGTQFQTIIMLLGRDATLTGRTAIWDGAVEAITKHPILGYGYSAFWQGIQGESANVVIAAKWLVPTAHNGFLDVWLQLGGIGMALVLFTLYQGCTAAVWCLRHVGEQAVEWSAGIMLFTILYNLDESFLIVPRELLWVAFSLAFLNLRAMMLSPRRQAPSSRTRGPRREFVLRVPSKEALAR